MLPNNTNSTAATASEDDLAQGTTSAAVVAPCSSPITNTTTTATESSSGADQRQRRQNTSAEKSAASPPSSQSASSDNSAASSNSNNSAGSGSGDGACGGSSDSGGEKAETEDDELQLNGDDEKLALDGEDSDQLPPCECVQCEVCMAENWWQMAAYQNSLLQQQTADGSSTAVLDQMPASFDVSANAATGLDLIGSAATLILSQQQMVAQHGADGVPSTEDLLRADFSMPKLREFFECQKAMGVPNFPEDFDEFWLLVVKARLFNIFKYRGPEAYNRIVLKIRDIARQFRAQVEERERKEAAEKAAADNVEKTTTASTKKQKKTSS